MRDIFLFAIDINPTTGITLNAGLAKRWHGNVPLNVSLPVLIRQLYSGQIAGINFPGGHSPIKFLYQGISKLFNPS